MSLQWGIVNPKKRDKLFILMELGEKPKNQPQKEMTDKEIRDINRFEENMVKIGKYES